MTRSYIAVRQVHSPGGVSTWTALGEPRSTRSRAIGDGINVATTLGRALDFSVAVFDGPDVVQMLDADGDPVGVEDEYGLIRDDLMEESRG